MKGITHLLFAAAVCIEQPQTLAADAAFVFEKDVATQVDLADKPLPRWRDGVMALIETRSGAQIGISVFVGQERSHLTFAVPGASYLTVRGFNRGADGTVALCGSLTDAAGRSGSYVGWISPANQETHVIRTSPFVAIKVALAADGSIWTQGSEIRPRAPGEAPRQTMKEALKDDATVFRQFSKAGKLLRAVVPQSEMIEPIALMAGVSSFFEAVGEGVVWYSSVSRQHFSIAADGAVVKTNDLPLPNNEVLSGGAFGARGELFASSQNGATWGVSRLDLAARRWVSVASGRIADRTETVHRPTLLGTDGDHLVVNGRDSLHVRFFRIDR